MRTKGRKDVGWRSSRWFAFFVGRDCIGIVKFGKKSIVKMHILTKIPSRKSWMFASKSGEVVGGCSVPRRSL